MIKNIKKSSSLDRKQKFWYKNIIWNVYCSIFKSDSKFTVPLTKNFIRSYLDYNIILINQISLDKKRNTLKYVKFKKALTFSLINSASKNPYMRSSIFNRNMDILRK